MSIPSQVPTSLLFTVAMTVASFVGFTSSLLAICAIWLIPSLKPNTPPLTRKIPPSPPRPRHRSLPTLSTSEPHELPAERRQSEPALPTQVPEEPVSPVTVDPPRSNTRPKFIRRSSVIFTMPWSTPRSRASSLSCVTPSEPLSPKSIPRSFLRTPSLRPSLSSNFSSYFPRRPLPTDATYASYLRSLPRFSCEPKQHKPAAERTPPPSIPAPSMKGIFTKPILRRRDASDNFFVRIPPPNSQS